MEQPINPYESSHAHHHAHQEGFVDSSMNIPVTPVALGALIATKFWVSLVGVVMLIMVAVQFLSFLFANSVLGGGFFTVLFMPLMMLIINLVLAVRLVQYGIAIGRLKSGGTSSDFERAMELQSKFWKLLGLVYAVMIVLMLLFSVGGYFLADPRF